MWKSPGKYKAKPHKPFPLTPDEERRQKLKGLALDPVEIIEAKHERTWRARTFERLPGGRSYRLIKNFAAFRQPVLYAIFMVIYYLLWIVALVGLAALASFARGFFNGHLANLPAILLVLAVLSPLPLFPHLLAWIQRDMYQKWRREYGAIYGLSSEENSP